MLDLKTTIKNVDGTDAMQVFMTPTMKLDEKGNQEEVSDYRVVTLKDILKGALLKTLERDQTNTEQKLKQYDLLLKVKDVEEVELTEEDVEVLVDLVPLNYGVLVTGQVLKLIK